MRGPAITEPSTMLVSSSDEYPCLHPPIDTFLLGRKLRTLCAVRTSILCDDSEDLELTKSR